MTRLLLLASLLVVPAVAAQDAGYNELAAKCGSGVKWAADDPWRPQDGKPQRDFKGLQPEVDRLALFEKAREQAKSEGKLILWYAFRVAGVQMYRSPLPDGYMMQVMFTEPEIVELVNRRFVPIRLFASPELGDATGVKAMETVEPALIFLDAEGKVVHKVDRIRTFNPDWLLSLCVHVLRQHGKDKVAGDAEARVLAGDYEGAAAALKDATDPSSAYWSAVLKRRLQDTDAALKALETATVPEAGAERGLALLRAGRIAEAKKALIDAAKTKSSRQAEASYHLAVAHRFLGEDQEAAKALADVANNHADSPWGWRAAANLNQSKDTTPDGALVHAFEDPLYGPAIGDVLPKDTNWVRGAADVDDVVRRAIEFLLRHQREDGGWSDTRYAYWPDPSILPNTRVAITSLAAAALLEWRDVDPKRIDEAVERGEKYALDDAHLNPGKNEECYSQAYRLLYLARKHAAAKSARDRKKALEAMANPIKGLERIQQKAGWWAHEYPNPFCTSSVLQCLYLAAKAGAPVPDKMVSTAATVLEKSRGKDGGYPYEARRPASGTKDSLARMPACEAVLLAAKLGSKDRLVDALTNWWEQLNQLVIVRRNDFHSNGELAGFFFSHALFHNCEATYLLDDKTRDEHLKKFLDFTITLPEIDGSFCDSHEMGKSYGTAMALLTLKNCLRNQTPTKRK